MKTPAFIKRIIKEYEGRKREAKWQKTHKRLSKVGDNESGRKDLKQEEILR